MKGSPVPQLPSILKDLIECSLNANVYLYLKSKAILIAMNDILRFFSKRSLFYAVSLELIVLKNLFKYFIFITKLALNGLC
jgi:hypothetical protein